jgi:hypothetical protein
MDPDFIFKQFSAISVLNPIRFWDIRLLQTLPSLKQAAPIISTRGGDDGITEVLPYVI